MTEFRVLLEGGDVLVVDIHVEEAAEEEAPDPTSVGISLLKALGLNMGSQVNVARASQRPAPRQKIVRPVEPDADDWLRDTSKSALKAISDGR